MDVKGPVLSDCLTYTQWRAVMNEIWRHHRFGGLSWSDKRPCRNIKYVRPSFDMRDGRCFTVSFDEVTFDFRGSERPMYERIMAWLNGEEAECGGL